MILRPLKNSDDLKIIYEKHYKDKFEFVDNFVCSFIIEDNGKIITGGGIRLVPEVVIYTDKSKPIWSIGRALVKTIETCIILTKQLGFDKFVAVTSDSRWRKQLIRRGFVEKGSTLSFRID